MLNIFSHAISHPLYAITVCLFLIRLLMFLLLHFESAFCILNTSPLLNMLLINTFCQFIVCLFILFTGYSVEQVFNFDEVQFISFFGLRFWC